MAAPVFQFNAKQALLGLGGLADKLRDKTPLLRIFGNLMVRSVQQTFRDEGSPASSWRKLYSSTRIAQWEAKPTRSGKKRSAFASSGANTRSFLRWNASQKILGGPAGQLGRTVTFAVNPPSAVLIGSNAKFARIHQLGGTITPKNKKFLRFPIGQGLYAFAKKVVMPARPYLVMRPEDPQRMAEAGMDYLIAKFKVTGGTAPAGEW